jgi:hypothetical protein
MPPQSPDQRYAQEEDMKDIHLCHATKTKAKRKNAV